ncbi:MAG: RagB/SusD family nutrient uptake outer membrane protein [Prevotella sp.]|nr:RagB/SusD family nutrient uptake outer membrane protein [Prevotella sp.]
MKKLIIFISSVCLLSSLSSCSDFFDQESDHVIYTENRKLTNSTDSLYSLTGIWNKLQALADRTILLGEVRGDLCTLTSVASSDLRDVSEFNIGPDNMYNRPRDYYAVINNCNYFIAHADTALKDNRNEYIFMREYAAVKAIRAWTYLQLVMNYGSVPFVTDPILTKEEAEKTYPRYDITQVAEYFINDLLPLAERYGRDYPKYGTIRFTDSRFFYFPINIVLGDLYLWHGSASGNKESFKQAALRYYKYISERNGDNESYPTSTDRNEWMTGSSSWDYVKSSWSNFFYNETYYSDCELITMIPCDSIPAEGNYSQLRNLFTITDYNDNKPSITQSPRMEEISEAQEYCLVAENGTTVSYSPKGMSNHRSGDLRLLSYCNERHLTDKMTGDMTEVTTIDKYYTRNVHIYRRQMIYLRMAEALNQAGYPRMAFLVLSRGLTNSAIVEDVYSYMLYDWEGYASDIDFLDQFSFPDSRYIEFTVDDLNSTGGSFGRTPNTMGIHSRGCGFTSMNEYYQLPVDTLRSEREQTADLQAYVDDLILTEGALEFSYEGTRYYDILRFAMRSANPGQFLAEKVYARRGEANSDIVRGEIKSDLTQKENWYLKWNGAIGF